MREFKIFAAIADIHIGIKHISASTIKEQLKKHFIKVLKQFVYLDGIFILGDILHTIVSLNSDYAEVYLWFIDQIYKIAKDKGSTVIIIKGTPSHDNEQLQNIYSYMNNDDGVDFRIYETISEVTIWKDFKLLLLPDVRIKKNKEVEQYLTEDHSYDMILGHGLIDTMRFFVQDSEHMPTHTYEYKVDQLISSSKGPVLFGHIHQFQNIRKHFYYVGPFTVLERGGLNAGFVVGGVSVTDRRKYRIEQYINPDSANYYNLTVSKKLLDQYPIDEIIEAIDAELENTRPNDLISLRITRDDSISSVDKVLMLETRYAKDRRITITKKVKTKAEEESEQKNEERKKKFSYVQDKNLTMSSILYKYYIEEVVPSIADQFSEAARITEESFKKLLGES